MIMLLAVLLVYIVIVAIFIRDDIPMITTSNIEADAIRVPSKYKYYIYIYINIISIINL